MAEEEISDSGVLTGNAEDNDDRYSSDCSSDEGSSYSDSDDDSALMTHTAKASSSQMQSSWRKNVRSIEEELKHSSHLKKNATMNDSDVKLDESYSSLHSSSNHSGQLFGGPAEFGGSRHNKKEAIHDENGDGFFQRMMNRQKGNTISQQKHDDHASSDEEILWLEKSLTKLGIEDVTQLQDMFVDENHPELERSFLKIVSPGHVRTNREFYETLKDQKNSATDKSGNPEDESEGDNDVAVIDDDDDEDYNNDDDYGFLKQATDDATSSPPLDEKSQIMIMERRAEESRADPSNYHSSDDEEEDSYENLGIQKDGSDSCDDSDDVESDDDEDGDDDSTTRKSDTTGSSDVDSERASATWQANVAAEKDEIDRISSHENSTTPFRKQKELMNSERLNNSLHVSEHSSMVSFDYSGTNSNAQNSLREDLEAQVKEIFKNKDQIVQREVEISMRKRLDSDDDKADDDIQELEAVEREEKEKEENNSDAAEVVAQSSPKKQEKQRSLVAAMTSMGCIYVLVLIVTVLVVGVVILAVFFVRAGD